MDQNPDEVEKGPSSDELRSQIAQTRAAIGGTVDAIQARLRPSRVMAAARDAAGGRVREHPVPVAVLAAAAAGVIARALVNETRRRARRIQWDPAYQTYPRNGYRSRSARRGNRGLLAAAVIGAACWAIWRGRSSTKHPAGRAEF